MRRISNLALAALVAGVLASSAVAKDGAFVGVTAGYDFSSKINYSMRVYDFIKDDGSSMMETNFNPSGNGYNFGIKAGYDIGFNRIYGGYSYGKGSSKSGTPFDIFTLNFSWKTHKIFAGYEFRYPIVNNFRVVAGAYAGAAFTNMELENSHSYSYPDKEYAYSAIYPKGTEIKNENIDILSPMDVCQVLGMQTFSEAFPNITAQNYNINGMSGSSADCVNTATKEVKSLSEARQAAIGKQFPYEVKVVDTSVEAKDIVVSGSKTDKYKFKSTNFLLGANLGVAYDITPNQAVDFGLRYEKIFNAKLTDQDSATYGADADFTNFGLYLGYSYKF